MIQLERNRTPSNVKAKYRNAQRVQNGAELIENWMTGAKKFYKNGFWKLAKDQLKAETSGKCAFCETPTAAAYYGDVEHFRPKKREMYWWLAYCFDNYLFSCRVCNGYKSDKFPIRGNQLPAPTVPANPTNAQLETISENMAPDPLTTNQRDNFDNACAGERAFLPNPYQEDPWVLFKWEVIAGLKEVNIAHRTQVARAVVEQTIEILKLNRDELRAQRYAIYFLLEGFKELFEISTGAAKDIAEDRIKEMMDSGQHYCGMARYFVTQEWQLGIPLPS